MGKETSVRTTTRVKEEKSQKPPKGAEILSKEVDTRTEEIKNGYLITKSTEIRWREKGSKDSWGTYYREEDKWFSKTDPLKVNINDEALADTFDDEEDKT